jgi:hypothetical protein
MQLLWRWLAESVTWEKRRELVEPIVQVPDQGIDVSGVPIMPAKNDRQAANEGVVESTVREGG